MNAFYLRQSRLGLSITLVLLSSLVGCSSEDDKVYTAVSAPSSSGGTQTPTPSAAPTATATPAPTVTPSATPTGTPSSTPTATPTAEPTAPPTVIPTAEPTPTPGKAGALYLKVPQEGASVDVAVSQFSCLAGFGCGVGNEEAILDPDSGNFADVNLYLSLLGTLVEFAEQEAITITVNLPTTVDPSIGIPIDPNNAESVVLRPESPGFVISFPDPALLSLSVLPEVRISLFNGDEMVGEATQYPWGLLDLIGLGIVALTDINNTPVYLSTTATAPYDKIRISFAGALLDLFVQINVHNVGLNGAPGVISGDSENPLPFP